MFLLQWCRNLSDRWELELDCSLTLPVLAYHQPLPNDATRLQLKMFFHCFQRGKMIIPAHSKVGILECHIYYWPIIDQTNCSSKNKTGPEIITGPYYYLFICFSTRDFSWWYPAEYFLENKTTTKKKQWGHILSLKILINIWEQFEMWSHESKRTERIFWKTKKCWSEIPSLNFPGDTWWPEQEEQNFKWSSSNSSSSSPI